MRLLCWTLCIFLWAWIVFKSITYHVIIRKYLSMEVYYSGQKVTGNHRIIHYKSSACWLSACLLPLGLKYFVFPCVIYLYKHKVENIQNYNYESLNNIQNYNCAFFVWMWNLVCHIAVSVVMHVWILWNVGNFLTTWKPVSISTLLHVGR